jgi:hypothetical protein
MKTVLSIALFTLLFAFCAQGQAASTLTPEQVTAALVADNPQVQEISDQLAAMAAAFTSAANTPAQSNIAAFGISYQPGASPSVAGTGLYARLLAGTGTYAFTAVDALPTKLKPFSVTTQYSAGIAQKILSIGGISIYIPTSAGVSYSGANTGWAWTTGALAAVPIKGKWYAMPNVRLVKSSVSGGTGYQVIGGVLIGLRW